MKKIEVAVIMGPFLPVPPLDGGAVEKLWFDLCKELVSKEISITQISKLYKEFPINEEIDMVKHIRVKGYESVNSYLKRLFLDFLYALRAVKAAKESDIIITNTFWAPVLAKILTSSKVWVSAHRFPKKQYFLYRNVDLIQPVSSSVAKGIIEQEPKIKNIVKMLPNFIKPYNGIIELEMKKKIILYVGRIHSEKGIEYLIKAYEKLPNIIKQEWQLRIIGPHEEKFGGEGNDYLGFLQKLACENVIFTGSIFDKEELNEEYKNASIFVYPSVADGEAFGLAPLEAMSFGCQTIVSNLDCFDDFIKDGVNGFKYNHLLLNDELEVLLKEAINRHDTPQHKNLINSSLETANKFDIKHVSSLFRNQIIRLYNEA